MVTRGMKNGAIEPVRVPRNPLDVLAQQIVAMASVEGVTVPQLRQMLQRTASYRELSDELLSSLLDMLSGRFPSTEFAELRARIVWDRDQDKLEGRPGSKMLTLVNAGTIPDRGLYAVVSGPDGPRLGELDEEMVHEMRPGQNFMLGATSWRVQEITRDRVIVSPAPGEPGQMPFWHGDGPGRPIELGRAIGATLRELSGKSRKSSQSWLEKNADLDPLARGNLLNYLEEQKEFTEVLPSDRTLVIERFRDELGDWRVCLLSPFGSRVHAPWALAIEARLGEQAGFAIQTMHTDDGIVLRMADSVEPPELHLLLPGSEEVEELVLGQLGHSAVFASHFRENAARALLLPRRRPGKRTPLWAQRLKAQNLLGVARNFPNFPIVLETYRSCLQDVFDLRSLQEILQAVERRQIRVHEVETESASPFARSLAFAYVAEYLYQGDSPLAERKAQALTLDRNLLQELLGSEQLRELLDVTVIEELEQELQCLSPRRRATSAEQLVDLLRRLGDLSKLELENRTEGDLESWLEQLQAERRVVSMQLAGESRFLLVEDVALYRDGFGAMPPKGLPTAFLGRVEDPLMQVFGRYARTHGPFEASRLAQRYGWAGSRVEPTLRRLCARNQLLEGGFHPLGSGREFCEPEVLRALRRRTLAKLRNQVAPVEAATLSRFLLRWHNVSGSGRLADLIPALEGLPLSFRDLETRILPARLERYRAEDMDRLGQSGMLVWVGCGSLGRKDGKVALYRRERIASMLTRPEPEGELDELQSQLMEPLVRRGECFFFDLIQACGQPPAERLLEALWDLVWMGLVTNDSFQALRSYGAPRRGRRRGPVESAPGRWVSVSSLLYHQPSDTERLMAWCQTLLERYGVVTREAVGQEGLPGGFTPIYQTLKALEESGRCRRGYFVEGLSGAQFAWSHTVDRLRTELDTDGEMEAVALAACDPANPYGSLLSWPENQGRPRRAAGASLVLVGGHPVLFLEKAGRKMTLFPKAEEPAFFRAAIDGLRRLARQRKGKLLRIEEINGQPCLSSPLYQAFLGQGLREDYKGLVLMVTE